LILIFATAALTISFEPILAAPPQVLGRVACRVTSKILGIGSAERAWGAVKHLKTGKRAHLGSEATKMQATIFGAACIEKARALKVKKEKSLELWTDDDVEFQLGLEDWDGEMADGPTFEAQVANERRLFNAWFEDWERVCTKKNDVVDEARLLTKYAGLRWLCPDSKIMYVADADNLEWLRGHGWCVIGQREDGELIPWSIKLLPSLIKKTKQLPEDNVEMVNRSKDEREKKRERKAKLLEEALALAKSKKGKRKGKRKRSGDSTDSSSNVSDSDGSE
jgi:hypothetical protein